ncbi:30S ribosomal protein S20 [Thalassospira alkalitolerans]|uniref:Small ribosomal subunit protein bS20 n=1 Tax=Thalassospira alkalitolerans TaxID=1293890 RepID=A0A1Y2LGM4_9PROT|nr:30S ribosomal protein S20 [Thalassospira alkalitolerans]OSQ50311.1 30S ribosomal protein S20 [Thalassospira alkalitolerans]|tara:strand:- start:40139 stop:40399 length:261 start_codon:yes stop_codon:yes gene_type:complete
MAHHKSAKKRILRNAARATVNGNRIGRIRSFVKKVEAALIVGDKDAALAALKIAEPEMARGAQLGVLHKNTVARKVSRLTARVKAL